MVVRQICLPKTEYPKSYFIFKKYLKYYVK